MDNGVTPPRHPAIDETQQYLRDEFAELRLHTLARAQNDLDDMQHRLDRERAQIEALR